jgi:hypothetical protein
MLTLTTIIMVGTVLTFPAAAVPQMGWSRADVLSRVSSLEHTIHARALEMRELKLEVSRLRAAMNAPDLGGPAPSASEELHEEAPEDQHPVARWLQDDGGVSSLCSSTDQATAALRTVQTVCCTQRGESCNSLHYPLSCDHGPECGLAVHTVHRLCGPNLENLMISAAPLQQAATLCATTSPPDMMPVQTLSDASRGGTAVPHACFSVLRTQVGGQYRNGWNALAVLQAPLGFVLSLTWRAFDLDDGDFIEIFENQTAMQARVRAQRLEGSQIPSPFTSESNTMLVKFVTNADGTSFGGSADITCARGTRAAVVETSCCSLE